MNPDLAYLIKSDSISLDDNTTLLVVYYYHRESEEDLDGVKHSLKDKTFYRCACRLDSNEEWKKLAEALKAQPADKFLLTSMGLPDRMNLRSDHIWSNYNAGKWIELKIFKKAHLLGEFLYGRRTTTGQKPGRKIPGAFQTKFPYIKEYRNEGLTFSLERPYDFPKGLWLVSTRVAPPRKQKKIIKD